MAKFCGNCGAEIKEGADVCIKCGKVVNKTVAVNPNSKSKTLCGLMGIFLGTFGVHNFILGYTGKGIAQVLLTCLGWILFGLGPIVASVWGLVEGIMILTGSINKDANGVPLKD